MVDPIADMLNRIKNAQAIRRETVEVPFSQRKYAIAKIFERYGFVKASDFKGKKNKKIIELTLQYQDGAPRVQGVRRVSKPGQRVYAASNTLHRVKGGRGIALVSTSKGIMTDSEARREGIGGEVLCEVW